MRAQLIIRLDHATKERFTRIARQEGKTASEKIRELLNSYIRKSDLSIVVDDIWTSISNRMRQNGVTEDDVDRVIGEVRAHR
jgi:predicted DNA-binding protein